MSLHKLTGRHFPFSVRYSTLPPLQEVQFQRLVQGHKVAMCGDPPERHIVLQRETQPQKHDSVSDTNAYKGFTCRQIVT